jgi:hypothetical protein
LGMIMKEYSEAHKTYVEEMHPVAPPDRMWFRTIPTSKNPSSKKSLFISLSLSLQCPHPICLHPKPIYFYPYFAITVC